jgi:hypothetical protein
MRSRLAGWRALLLPGDVLVFALGVLGCIAATAGLMRTGVADGLVVRSGGRVYAAVDLDRPRRIEVPGPLGLTRIEVEPGRARVAADPGPRQYCVRQGWLSRAGAVAICAPNEVSLELTGRGSGYDSLNY